MRFSCISEPQRNATSLLTSILPSQMIWPPARTASEVIRNAAALPAASITTSAPRPPVCCLPAATTSSFAAFTPDVAPIFAASSSFAGSRSTAIMAPAPASRAPCTAADHHRGVAMRDGAEIECRADARHDATADQAGAVERDFLGHGNGLLIGHHAVFAERSEEHQLLKYAAIGQRRAAFADERHRLRSLAEILLAQDRGVAVAAKAVAAMRLPR